MSTPRRRTVEVETVAELDRRVASGAATMAGWHLQGLDLTGRVDVLARLDARGAVLLGCRLPPEAEDALREGGALVFPNVPEVPVDPYRAHLYTPAELYDGLTDASDYGRTLDARVHAWSCDTQGDLYAGLTQALHDLAVDDALEEHVRGRRLVGVMGGHDAERGSTAYRDAARLGRALGSAGLTVTTGGGPGAMEAANLGAYLSGHPENVLDEALALLAVVPGYGPSVAAWAGAAFQVRERWPDGGSSLGVPTWFYGHEPPNAFPDAVAKYFKNAIREDILLHVCSTGVVFLPGRAGTVQEVFQNACENYYADPVEVAPMVLVGRDFWTRELPAWPLLRALAHERELEHRVHLVDDPGEVAPLLLAATRPPG